MTNPISDDPYFKARTRSGVADPRAVATFHERSDLDASKNAQHHTIGVSQQQAAAGNHNHDGANSVALLAGITFTGAKGGNAALASVIAGLVTLGATDTTTA
jgi:hypothetical protein